ncbi:CU044_5270 family protein [Kribbella sp. DT2]|uniref:CU044_5270 family protein n=1 Tax=Kribbella sp. DT2 TaxID=3393427 RepID=UPI003CF7B1AA
MTDLKKLLDEVAGPEPVVGDDEVAADLGRGQKAARRRRLGGAGLVGGGALVAVAALSVPLVLAPGAGTDAPAEAGPPAASTPVEPPVRQLTAGAVLLVAAAAEERGEVTTGKYFRVRTTWTRDLPVGRDKTPYKIRETFLQEDWTGRAGGSSYRGRRSLGAKPATAADEAVWRQAGSPTSWNLGKTDTVVPRDQIITASPGKGELDKLHGDADRYDALGVQGVPLKEILALPSTPDGLRARLLQDKAHRAKDADDTSYLVGMATGLLETTPALPKVRGAALRLLSGLPGAEVEENVPDTLGRKGTAVTFAFPALRSTVRLLIEPRTGKLLSSEHLGGKIGRTVVLASGWTDDQPTAPVK